MNEQDLKARIDELEMEIDNKDMEIVSYLDKIEGLEERIMKLEMLISDKDLEDSNLDDSDLDTKSRLRKRFDQQEKQIRDLKNRMGFLRKEKIQLQKRLENLTEKENKKYESTVIRIEEKKPPLDTLVKDLQARINKQKIIIKNLTEEKPNLAKYEEKLKHKDERIGELEDKISEIKSSMAKKNKEIVELKKVLSKNKKQGIKGKETTARSTKNHMFSGLTEELQEKLNKSRIKIKNLQDKLGDTESESLPEDGKKLKEELDHQNVLIEKLQTKLEEERQILEKKIEEYNDIKNQAETYYSKCEELKDRIDKKDKNIKELQQQIKSLRAETEKPYETAEDSYTKVRLNELKDLVEELKKQNIQQRTEIQKLRQPK